MVAVMKWKIHQMDFNKSFLNGVVKEEVYVEQSLGFETHDTKTRVCKLKKDLYGLKQAPRTWYDRMDCFLMSLGFTKSKANSSLCFTVEDGRPVILLLYVDDFFLTGDEELIKDARRIIDTEFEINYLDMMHYFLGMEVWQSEYGIFLV